MHADLDQDLAPQQRDPLTGLANLEGLAGHHLAAESPHRARASALALLDVRRFSEVNEALGFEVGDELLRALGRRIAERLPEGCAGARLGADVYAVLGPCERVTPQFMRSLLRPPLAVLEHDMPLDAAFGLYGPLDAQPARVLLHRARAALVRAKRHASDDCAWFEAAQEDLAHRSRGIVRDLRDAFVRGRLELWYQPQLSLQGSEVVGIEALLRWPGGHPPAVFVPLAERTGLMVNVGEWVLRRACGDYAHLKGLGLQPAHLSVNLSLAQLRSPGFVSFVEAQLRACGIEERQLQLEIPNLTARQQPHLLIPSLAALRRMGVLLSVEDVGADGGAVGLWPGLPADGIKLDRALVGAQGDGGEALLHAVASLGRQMGLAVSAEGVETAAQRGVLVECGCEVAQGYLYAQPMPLDALISWLLRHLRR